MGVIFLVFFFLNWTASSASIVRIPFEISQPLETLWVSGWTENDYFVDARIAASDSVGFFTRNSVSVLVPTSDQYRCYRFARRSDMIETGDENVIGVGIESFTMNLYNSVTVIKFNSTSGQLVLGADGDFFVANCLPSSILSVEFRDVSGFFRQPVFHSRIVLGNLFIGETLPSTFGDLRNGIIMEIDPEVFGAFVAMLAGNGSSMISSNPYTFSNCSTSFLREEFLPIHIEFGDSGGRIQLNPEEYIALDNGRCILRVVPSYGPQVARIINPFAIPYMNIRFTRFCAELCDSI
jgi:hypothetical protein